MMTLFVSNIDFQADESELEDFFIQAGYPPDKVRICIDRDTGQSRGFGFLEFEDSRAGLSAMQDLHGEKLLERRINVREARPRAAAGDNGGGGGRHHRRRSVAR